MSNIDDKIKAAMDAEYAQEWEKLEGEQRLDQLVLEAFRGRNSWMNILVTVVMLVLFVALIFMVRQYALATNVKELLSYGMLAGFCMCGIGMLKLWGWLEIERIATAREIKRLELQIAMLARDTREGRGGPAAAK